MKFNLTSVQRDRKPFLTNSDCLAFICLDLIILNVHKAKCVKNCNGLPFTYSIVRLFFTSPVM